MAVGDGKKRYYLSLTQENMTKFKQMLSEFGAPTGTESILIDEYISGMVNVMGPVIRRVYESGKKPSMGDFFQMVGVMMKDLESEQMKL